MISALVTIREASAEDEAALCSMWCAAWGATFPAIDYHARWPAMWRRWRDMEAEIFVAMRGKSLIGMIVLGVEMLMARIEKRLLAWRKPTSAENIQDV